MSKTANENDGSTRSGTGCFITVANTHMATVGVKGLIKCAFEINTNEIDTTVSYVYD